MVKIKEATFSLALMISDSQLREREIEGLYDDPYTFFSKVTICTGSHHGTLLEIVIRMLKCFLTDGFQQRYM